MIYELNGKVHWEISPDVMRAVVEMINARDHVGEGDSDSTLIGLSNLRGAFECELYRLENARDKRVYKAEGFPVDPNDDLFA